MFLFIEYVFNLNCNEHFDMNENMILIK